MSYVMIFFVDGGCRNNGGLLPYGGAAAIWKQRCGRPVKYTQELPGCDLPRPTNQRAEIMAIILALEAALDFHENTLGAQTRLRVTIFSDSQYAVNCMTDWIHKWSINGWINARNQEVVNRDLIQRASTLGDRVAGLGKVRYKWIPRSRNKRADELANEVMDRMI